MIKWGWKELQGYWKYLKYIVMVVVLLVSYKPALFTWHLVNAGYFFQLNPHHMANHMVSAMVIRPKAYLIFKKYNPSKADDSLMRALLQKRDISILNAARPTREDRARFQRVYKNNAYLRYLFPHFLTATPWLENLDDLSLELLADPLVNEMSKKVFTPHLTNFSPSFMQNVADFCTWKGNAALASFWAAQAKPRWVKDKPFDPAPPITTSITTTQSLARLQDILMEKYRYHPDALSFKENLMAAGSFETPRELEQLWTFSDVTDFGPLGSGSFTMGTHEVGGNRMLRLMGFFVKNAPHQKSARAGALLNKKISLTNQYYLFSFDYAAQTGKESISFFLGDYIGERRLPAVKGLWKKTILIIYGKSGKYKQVQPLIRMWGKGTLLVDNVCLFKLTDPGQTLPVKTTLLVENTQNTGAPEAK